MDTLSPYRIGQGYDLHRLIPLKPLYIGGIRIDSPVGTEAHSDGDVLLHSLIDALLGACALGDIGEHFPPSDEQYRDIESSHLLKIVLPWISEKNYKILNVDITVFLEKPSLKPYKQTIKENLAVLLKIPVDCIAVKAKTSEGFPPIGTQDAIAASVTVLLERE